MNVTIEEEAGGDNEDERGHATVEVAPDQQSLAIGRGGQNVRLAAKLTGWKIDITSVGGEELAESDGDGTTEIKDEAADTPEVKAEQVDTDTTENEDGTTEKPDADPLEKADVPTDGRDADKKEENVVDTPENFEEQMAEAETESEAEQEAAEDTEEEKK